MTRTPGLLPQRTTSCAGRISVCCWGGFDQQPRVSVSILYDLLIKNVRSESRQGSLLGGEDGSRDQIVSPPLVGFIL